MDILKQKKNIFGEIAALRVSAEGYPKKTLLSSVASINKKANSLNFLIDLQKTLAGAEDLKESIIELLTQHLGEIELEVKSTLKKALKNMVSCGINPSIPDWVRTDGITVEVSKIDFLNTMKIDPSTKAGNLLYDDIVSASESSDFNTFLYHVIQNNGGSGYWGHVTSDGDILDIKFEANGATPTTPNNSLVIKTSSAYPTTNKLTDFNNDYIDSISLFKSPKMINSMVDNIFGSISFNVSKDKKSIERGLMINDIINKIINSDDDTVIDDSYFTFTNDEYADIEYRTNLKSQGRRILETSDEIDSVIAIDSLTTLNDELNALMSQAVTGVLTEQITNVLRTGLNQLAEESASNADEKDKMSIKADFMENMLKNLMTSIINIVLSPKLILIFAINYKIAFNEEFTSPEDFLKKNKWIITMILESIRDVVIKFLLARVLKKIKELVTEDFIKTQVEKLNAKKAQLASLLGVPNKVLRKITGIIK